MRVLVVGIGLMGSAAAERLVEEGFDVILWNRTRDKAVELARRIGANAIDNLVEAVATADVALAFLADDDALFSVASLIPRQDGLVFINSSTVTPTASSAVAAHLEGRGVCYVEAPVLGGPRAVREGRVIALVAGKRYCLGTARAVLAAISSDIVELGEAHESAQALKLAFNNLLITTLASLAESALIAEAYGVGIRTLKEILSMTVFSEFSEKYLDRLASPSWKPSFKLSMAAKDLVAARSAAWAKRVPAPLASVAAELYSLASAHGLGDEDYSRIYWFIKGRAGKEGDEGQTGT